MTESEALKEIIEENNMRINNIKYWLETNPSINHSDCYRNIKKFEIANKAVEKQIPKKVKIQQWIDTKCECGYEFFKHHGDGYYSIPLEKKTNYCPNCGQRLDFVKE